MPRQTSIQLTPAMERQLDALKAAGYGGTTDVFRLALDRMYQQEQAKTAVETPKSPAKIASDN